jgi:hypothetical protein
MDYKNKYLKYKNKYLNLKLQKGGNPFNFNQPDINNILSTLGQEVEYCGHFQNNDGILFVVSDQTNKGDFDNGRAMCSYNSYNNIVWHTHPNTSKYYPSLEDILKVLKHDIIYFSYIFTQFGYWTMYFEGVFEHVADPKFIKFVDDVNNKFYFESGNGREFNPEAIEYYVNKLSSTIKGFQISFNTY